MGPFDPDKGDRSVAEDEVRLDEVLAIGCSTPTATATSGRTSCSSNRSAPLVDRVRCTGGSAASPPEDSGGGWDRDATTAPPFDLDAAQKALAGAQATAPLPPEIVGLKEQLRLGLLRVVRGRLLVTKAGAALKQDPVRLWRHVAERLARLPKSGFPRAATPLLLMSVAGGTVSDARLADVLTAAGWRDTGGSEVDVWAIFHATGASAPTSRTAPSPPAAVC